MAKMSFFAIQTVDGTQRAILGQRKGRQRKVITLREVCKAEGVTRRAVQGYEQAGLVTPTGRNERGHLLYDQLEQEKIRQIKFFQEMGFSIKEIRELSEAPANVVKEMIEERIEILWQEINKKESIIKIAKEMLKQL